MNALRLSKFLAFRVKRILTWKSFWLSSVRVSGFSVIKTIAPFWHRMISSGAYPRRSKVNSDIKQYLQFSTA
jgi:hypothetical protein